MMPHVFSDVSTIDFFSFYKKYYSEIKIIVLNLGKPISPDKPKGLEINNSSVSRRANCIIPFPMKRMFV